MLGCAHSSMKIYDNHDNEKRRHGKDYPWRLLLFLEATLSHQINSQSEFKIYSCSAATASMILSTSWAGTSS